MRPEPDLTFFVDACLGRFVVADLLRAAGATVVAHDDVFKTGTPDQEWLAEVGNRGWVVLTKDRRIRYRENEKRALRLASVYAFVFAGGSRTGEEIGAALVKALPAMRRLIVRQRNPFIASVTSAGAITILD